MGKVNDITDKCLQVIAHFECSGHPENYLNAYRDIGHVWTIGIGTTRYPDGSKVKQGDIITLEEAWECLKHDVNQAMLAVDALTTDAIEQHEFDALVSFVYNEGPTAYRKSQLRTVINKNHKNYEQIVQELLRWKYDTGVVIPGLVRRRKAEAFLYVYGELKFYFKETDNIV